MKSDNTKGNPNHDEQGRFTSGENASTTSGSNEEKAKKLFGMESNKPNSKYTHKRAGEYDNALSKYENLVKSGDFDKEDVLKKIEDLNGKFLWDVNVAEINMPTNESDDIEQRIHDLKNAALGKADNKPTIDKDWESAQKLYNGEKADVKDVEPEGDYWWREELSEDFVYDDYEYIDSVMKDVEKIEMQFNEMHKYDFDELDNLQDKIFYLKWQAEDDGFNRLAKHLDYLENEVLDRKRDL